MKKAVILHGTDGSPEGNWFQWLKKQLEASGYEVWVPELPDNHTPNKHIYNDFLFGSDWNFTDNLVVGHSSGAVAVLNLLEDDRCPRINTGILVSSWPRQEALRLEGTGMTNDQFDHLFPEAGFNFDTIMTKTNQLLYVHGDNDPYCLPEDAKWLAAQTNSEITMIPGGVHLGDTRTPEFPELLELLHLSKLI